MRPVANTPMNSPTNGLEQERMSCSAKPAPNSWKEVPISVMLRRKV